MTDDPWVGTELAGCRIERPLGKGGMGAVYLGHHRTLDRPVAVKVLDPELVARKPKAVKRFVREARTAARLRHPNLLQIYDVVAGELRGETILCMVMELIEGRNLKTLIAEAGALEAEPAARHVMAAAEGLGAAHAAGVVHRDVKPSNLVVTSAGQLKVIDFGLARAEDADADGLGQLTQQGGIVGTPRYMAPEQARAKPVDARTDVYALGATLFCALTGQPPFTGDTLAQILVGHLERPVPPLPPSVPPRLCDLVARMLAKSPDDRPADGAAAAGELAAFLRDPYGPVPAAPVAVDAPPAAPVVAPPPSTQRRRAARSSRRAAAPSRAGVVPLVGLLAVGVLAIVAWVATSLVDDGPEEVPPVEVAGSGGAVDPPPPAAGSGSAGERPAVVVDAPPPVSAGSGSAVEPRPPVASGSGSASMGEPEPEPEPDPHAERLARIAEARASGDAGVELRLLVAHCRLAPRDWPRVRRTAELALSARRPVVARRHLDRLIDGAQDVRWARGQRGRLRLADGNEAGVADLIASLGDGASADARRAVAAEVGAVFPLRGAALLLHPSLSKDPATREALVALRPALAKAVDLGRVATELEYGKPLVALAAGDPSVRLYQLGAGMHLHLAGAHTEARAHLDRALKGGPTPKEAMEVRRARLSVARALKDAPAVLADSAWLLARTAVVKDERGLTPAVRWLLIARLEALLDLGKKGTLRAERTYGVLVLLAGQPPAPLVDRLAAARGPRARPMDLRPATLAKSYRPEWQVLESSSRALRVGARVVSYTAELGERGVCPIFDPAHFARELESLGAGRRPKMTIKLTRGTARLPAGTPVRLRGRLFLVAK